MWTCWDLRAKQNRSNIFQELKLFKRVSGNHRHSPASQLVPTFCWPNLDLGNSGLDITTDRRPQSSTRSFHTFCFTDWVQGSEAIWHVASRTWLLLRVLGAQPQTGRFLYLPYVTLHPKQLRRRSKLNAFFYSLEMFGFADNRLITSPASSHVTSLITAPLTHQPENWRTASGGRGSISQPLQSTSKTLLGKKLGPSQRRSQATLRETWWRESHAWLRVLLCRSCSDPRLLGARHFAANVLDCNIMRCFPTPRPNSYRWFRTRQKAIAKQQKKPGVKIAHENGRVFL